jgi:hypothetical protein
MREAIEGGHAMREETPEQLNRWMRQTRRSLPVIAACFICAALAVWVFGQSLHIPDRAGSILIGIPLTLLIGNSIILLYVRYRLRTNPKTAE